MNFDEEEYLEHYGTPRKSGRYAWGSGGNVPSSGRTLLQQIEEMRKQGLSDSEIHNGLGMTSTEFRDLRTLANNERKRDQIAMARTLRDKGTSHKAIGERMGIGESSVRALLKDGEEEKAAILGNITNKLRDSVNEKGIVDVGQGVEARLGISETRLRAAVTALRAEGYTLHNIKNPQTTSGNQTNMKVLAPPGMTTSEVYKNRDKIQQVDGHFIDNGRTVAGILPPKSISPNRVHINYAEDGGAKADGVIFVRPGVEDVSLGGSNYAQVRVKVGDTHYLKGMALYKEGLPEGTDIIFNTNKKRADLGDDKFAAMKELKPEELGNPFGAIIKRQITKPGNEKELSSVMNLVNEEGDWGKWKNTISSQVLSKQKPKLAKEQLDLAYESRVAEFERLSAITNPTIRRKLLEGFGDQASSAAVQLKAAALPRQSSHVILPLDSIKPNQVYAPGFNQGESVVLIRYPHGGKFEIPELVVNNKVAEGKQTLGNSRDAIGIHHTVAQRLSGADFDGDVVLVIPNNQRKIDVAPALDGLKNFDPQSSYPGYPGMKALTPSRKGQLMGDVSNLITDMTIAGAPMDEVARAIKHSMVVIDAEKHNLDYKLSAEKNGIGQLKAKYQRRELDGKTTSGAATLISRAKSPERVPKRTPRPARLGGPIDKETGKRVFIETSDARFVDAKGRERVRTQASTKLAETDDATTLSSGTLMENIYAEHSNKLKALGNLARKESVNTPNSVYNPSAAKTYANEVETLRHKLAVANQNRPLERQANVIANAEMKSILDAEPNLHPDHIKRYRQQTLTAARLRTGASGATTRVRLEPREWEAIQAGAIHDSTIRDILAVADLDNIKEFAIPKQAKTMTPSKTKRAQDLLNRGFTRAEVASHLGVSLSTLDEVTDALKVKDQ